MSILNSISKLAADYRVYAERSSAMRTLNGLSDHQLADIGVERYQLAAGVSAYPWRSEKVASVEKLTPVRDVPVQSAPNFATTMITLYSAWGRPVRAW